MRSEIESRAAKDAREDALLAGAPSLGAFGAGDRRAASADRRAAKDPAALGGADRERAGGQVKTVDVLIPAFNEERNVGVLIERLFGELRDPRYRIEVVVVDDGSTDRTADVVRECALRHPVTLLSLSRNFGKETALLAALDYCDADAAVIMDADLQHPIELIPRFFELWEAGYRCVYAYKESRRGESRVKALLVRLFYALVNHDSRFRIRPDAVDFRLLDHSVVAAMRSMRERVRFTKGLFAWVGFRSAGVGFVPDPRASGVSKFTRRSLFRLGWDGLTSFSDLPLRLSTGAGIVVSLGALAYGAFILLRTLFFGVDVPGWATLVVAVTFLSGVQMLFLGIIGQYLRAVFLETKNRPSYVVADVAVSPLSERGLSSTRAPAAPLDDASVSPPPARPRATA